MNYRGGFQRLYGVFTVAWVASVLYIVPTGRLEFWSVAQSTLDPAQSILDPVQIPKSVKNSAWQAYYDSATTEELEKALNKMPLPTEAKADLWDAKNAETQWASTANLPPGHTLDVPTTPPVTASKSRSSAVSPPPESRTRKLFWLAGVLFFAPATGYFLLFYVVGWVYRGFKPALPARLRLQT